MCLGKRTKVRVLLIAAALLLPAGAPRDAEAQLCRVLKSKQEGIKKKNCVVAGDVKNESVKINQVRDAARSGRFFSASDTFSLQEPGLVLVTAAAEVDASGSGGPVSVRCALSPGPTALDPAPHTITDSLNPAEDVAFANVVATKIFQVRKGRFWATFSCVQITGSGAAIEIPGVAVRYVPTNY